MLWEIRSWENKTIDLFIQTHLFNKCALKTGYVPGLRWKVNYDSEPYTASVQFLQCPRVEAPVALQ